MTKVYDVRIRIYWTSETGPEMEQGSFAEFCDEQGFSEVWRAEIGEALRHHGCYRLAPQRAGDVPLIVAVDGMTFKEFQATGRDCADLGAVLDNALWDSPQAGRLYGREDCPLYIERCSGGEWQLVLERDGWLSDDLPALERRLYEFAIEAGYLR